MYCSGVELVAIFPVISSTFSVMPPPVEPLSTGLSVLISGAPAKDSTELPSSDCFINAFHIGAATILPPYPRFIAVLSVFPAHTPATSDGVYPIAQAST